MTAPHFITVAEECGHVVTQCRCPAPSKAVRHVPGRCAPCQAQALVGSALHDLAKVTGSAPSGVSVPIPQTHAMPSLSPEREARLRELVGRAGASYLHRARYAQAVAALAAEVALWCEADRLEAQGRPA